MDDIEQNYSRCFSTASGAVVMKHLRKITIERTLGPAATDAELRGLEAQRALVHQIEALIRRGKI